METKPKVCDSEKITINLGLIDLGQIDLLVQEGFYANRTDLIRTAIRNQLGAHADAVKQAVARKTLVLGIQHFSAADLRALRKARQMLQVRVLGLATIAPDVTPELALSTESPRPVTMTRPQRQCSRSWRAMVKPSSPGRPRSSSTRAGGSTGISAISARPSCSWLTR